MQIAEKIIEKNFINQCVKDKEINEKYGAILLEYLDWFLNPNDPNRNAWCPREAFAKIEGILDLIFLHFEKIFRVTTNTLRYQNICF